MSESEQLARLTVVFLHPDSVFPDQAAMCKANSAFRSTISLDSSLCDRMISDSELIDEKDRARTAEPFHGRFTPKECLALGVCVCQTQNHKDIKYFWANVARIFRQYFWSRKKIKSEPRKLLEQNLVFLKFSLSHKTAHRPLPVAGPERDELDSLFEDEVSQHQDLDLKATQMQQLYDDQFFHVGYINLKTMHFGVCHLQCLEQHQVTSSAVSVLSIEPLQSSGAQASIFTDMKAIARFDMDVAWNMSFHTLSMDFGDWSCRDDCTAAVVPMPMPNDISNEFVVWQGSQAEAERRRVAESKSKAKEPKGKKRKQGQGAKSSDNRQPQQKQRKGNTNAPEQSPEDQLLELLDDDMGVDLDVEPPLADEFQVHESLDELNPYLDPEEEEQDEDQVELERFLADLDQDDDKADKGPDPINNDAPLDPSDSPSEGGDLAVVDEESEALLAELAAAPPAVIAPVAHAKPAAKAASSRSTANREVFPVGSLGELRYYTKTGVMSAACAHHSSNDCRRSATTIPSRGGSGRPIGSLVAWLQLGASCSSRTEHVHGCKPTLAQRQAARTFWETLPGHDQFEINERPKARNNDPNEPVIP